MGHPDVATWSVVGGTHFGTAAHLGSSHVECGAAVLVLPMPLVSALELVLNRYDIYDVDTLVTILRSPHNKV